LKLDSVEKVYTKIHAEIKANPDKVKNVKKAGEIKYTDKRKTIVDTGRKTKEGKAIMYKKDRKLTLDERKANVKRKIEKAVKAVGGGKKKN